MANITDGALAGLLGITVTELENSIYTQDADGKKIPKSQNEIDDYVKSKNDARLIHVKSQAKSEGQGMQERLTKERVENYLKEKFPYLKNVDAATTEELVDAIQVKPTNKEITEDDLKSSPIFLAKVKELNDKLTEERDAHVKTKQSYKENEVRSYAIAELKNMVKAKDANFMIPSDEKILDSWLGIVYNNIRATEGLSIDVVGEGENKQVVLKDAKGNAFVDSTYTPVQFATLAMTNAKNIIPAQVAKPGEFPPEPGTPPGKGAGPISLPTFETRSDLLAWIDSSVMNPEITPEMIEQVNSKHENLK